MPRTVSTCYTYGPDDVAEDVEAVRDAVASTDDPSAVADSEVSTAWTNVRGWVDEVC